MSMTPLQSWAIHWTAQEIVGLYCIRFPSGCILKARVLGVRVPLPATDAAAAAAAPANAAAVANA